MLQSSYSNFSRHTQYLYLFVWDRKLRKMRGYILIVILLVTYWRRLNAGVHFAVLHVQEYCREDELCVDTPWFHSLETDCQEEQSMYLNCLDNTCLEYSPISLLSWLPYNSCMRLQRDTYRLDQPYLLSACQLLDTSWSGRLGRTCVCASWFHIHSLLGSCILCYL